MGISSQVLGQTVRPARKILTVKLIRAYIGSAGVSNPQDLDVGEMAGHLALADAGNDATANQAMESQIVPRVSAYC